MNRREQAEYNYRKKFDEFGLSERFEFLRREWSMDRDKRFWCMCKTCEKEFLSWPEVFKGRQKHLLCPECGAASDGVDIWTRTPRFDEAMEYYQQGHSVSDTAKVFGVTNAQINNAVRVRGITNGRQWHKARVEDQKADAEQQLAKHLSEIGFEYIGGYIDEGGKVAIKCRTCGDVFERTAGFAKRGNLICKKCEHEKTLLRQAQRKKERSEELKQKAIEQAQAKEKSEAEKADSLFHLLNDKNHVCTVCGCSFSIAEFMKNKKRKLVPTAPKYCSKACERRANHRKSRKREIRSGNIDKGNHRHRARKYGVAYESGITLKKLWERDGGICQICGKPCDWNDRSWNKYCGPTYPSDDHIIPMVKGGPHTWDNVQLAHMMCNSEKGDRI